MSQNNTAAEERQNCVKRWQLYDVFAEGNGMQVVDVTDNEAVTTMIVEERHLNGVGVCQGGALFTLADLAMAAVTNQRGKSVSTDANIRFLSAANKGELLECRMRLVKDGRLPVVEGEIKSGDRLVAVVGGRDFRLE